MFAIEMVSKDDLQNDMLQMMLKRLLILCTRVYKEQTELTTQKQLDIVIIQLLSRKQFKTKHQVADYAEMLNKSPKTLSNLFKKYNEKNHYKLFKTAPSLKHAVYAILTRASKKSLTK
jgi:AraC-like DNA-binding protein